MTREHQRIERRKSERGSILPAVCITESIFQQQRGDGRKREDEPLKKRVGGPKERQREYTWNI